MSKLSAIFDPQSPSFPYRAYSDQLEGRKDQWIKIFNAVEECNTCADFLEAGFEDIILFKMVHRSRAFTHWLFQFDLNLSQEKIERALVILRDYKNFSYPHDPFNHIYFQHLIRVCEAFKENERMRSKFDRLHPPLFSHFAMELIRASLMLSNKDPIGSKEIKAAVFSAMITPLRQSVGSCFATAPAMLLQNEQSDQIFEDLFQLIYTGRLRKTIRGEDYKVPLSLTYGRDQLNQWIPDRGIHFIVNHPALKSAALLSNLFLTTKEYEKAIEKVYDEKERISYFTLIRRLLYYKWGLTEEEVSLIRESSNLTSQHLRAKTHLSIQREKKCEQCIQQEKELIRFFMPYFCHPLLKSWEFTIASFADYQINAFKWNMIVALGFSHEEVGGIGKVIYDDLDAGLKIRNDELMNLQQEAERAENQLNMIQTLMSSATSEGRIRKLKADANAQMHHLRTCENMLQDAIKDTEYHSRFYQFLLSQYETLFHFYFQEIYDPEMGAKDQFFSQDSPAGFRLIYKHGRSEPDVWERIEDEKLYIRSLCDFFEAIPSALISACEWEKGKEEIYRITRKIIEHVQSPLFLRTAYERIQKSPFKGGHKTPWSYVSGANLQALVRCYFSRENQLTCEKAMAATEKDLCIIWIDQMKAQEQKLLDQFIKYPHRSLLAESPTHAFLFQPGLELFKNAWSDKGFTYTWLRDQIIEPSVQFYRLIRLEPMEQVFLINRLLDSVNLPRSFLQKFRFDANRALTLREFQEKLIGWLKKSNLTFDEVVLKTFLHGVLVRSIPFSSKENIYQLVTRHPDIFDQTQFNSLILDDPIAYDSLVHMLILLGDKCHIQLSDLIELFQSHKMIYPKSLYFADTNWVDYFFSFRINPITLELDLWRSTLDGLKAYPMINWKQSFKENGEPWIIYNHPEEYVANRMTIDTLSPNIKKV